jgi:hypothetical protein
MYVKWQLSIRGCGKNGNSSHENIVKFGYKLDMKYKYLINLLYLWLNIEKNYKNLVNFIFSRF